MRLLTLLVLAFFALAPIAPADAATDLRAQPSASAAATETATSRPRRAAATAPRPRARSTAAHQQTTASARRATSGTTRRSTASTSRRHPTRTAAATRRSSPNGNGRTAACERHDSRGRCIGPRAVSWQGGLPAASNAQSDCPAGTMATLARGHTDVTRCMPL